MQAFTTQNSYRLPYEFDHVYIYVMGYVIACVIGKKKTKKTYVYSHDTNTSHDL